MVVDTSAVVAILRREPKAEAFRSAMKAAERRFLSAATRVELGIVAFARAGEPGLEQMRTLLDQLRVETVETTERQADEAIDAFRRFGGRRHPAALNLGDCFSYALAEATGEPLLFKGNDFARTDVERASAGQAGPHEGERAWRRPTLMSTEPFAPAVGARRNAFVSRFSCVRAKPSSIGRMTRGGSGRPTRAAGRDDARRLGDRGRWLRGLKDAE